MLVEKPITRTHELGQTREYQNTVLFETRTVTPQPTPQLLSPDNPYSILVIPDLLEGCPRSRFQTELGSLGP